MAYDYSAAPEQRDGIELIPDGTTATLQMTVRPGGAGDGGLLKRSKDGGCEMLDCEFVVVDGPHVKRKLWERMVVSGTTNGHAQAADISRGKLRAIIESARGIKPNDVSPEARKARTVEFSDFNGLRFMARIGVEKGRPKNDGSGENYADRNTIAIAITPDRKDWHAVEQAPQPTSPIAGGAGIRPYGAHRQAFVGVMRNPIGAPTASALEDVWQRRSTAAAIAAARKVVTVGNVIPPGTPIGRLGDIEWGWPESIDTELAIRMTGLDPEPWDGGAVATILPELAETPDFDWAKPLGEWPRETMVKFLLVAMRLIRKAMIARDLSDRGITRKSSANVIARQANAAAGGPLMTPDELNDDLEG